MRPYEAMVIFDAGAEAPAIQAVVDRLLETIRANEGVPGHVDRWGRRPFAYEVKHRREGYYVVVELSGVPRTVAEIERLLTLADEVLRYKVIRIPDKIAQRVASGAASHARPGTRGPASRGQSGRGPRSEGSGRGEDAGRAPGGEDETLVGQQGSAAAPVGTPEGAEDGASSEAAADGAGPATG